MLGYDDHHDIILTVIKAWPTQEEQARHITNYLVAILKIEKEKTNDNE